MKSDMILARSLVYHRRPALQPTPRGADQTRPSLMWYSMVVKMSDDDDCVEGDTCKQARTRAASRPGNA